MPKTIRSRRKVKSSKAAPTARRRAARIQKLGMEVDRARRALRTARFRLTKATRPDDAHLLVHPRLRRHHDLVCERKDELLDIPGVVGVSLGVREATASPEPVLRVYLRSRKAEKDLPRSIRSGRLTLPIESMVIGRIRRHARPGDRITRSPSFATIGAFAVDDQMRWTAITAMHLLAPLKEYPEGAEPPIELNIAGQVGSLVEGTSTGVDALRAEVPFTEAVNVVPEGRVQGWRPMVNPSDEGIPVFTYGAVSGLLQGTIVDVAVNFKKLDSVITVKGMPTHDGDSGAALLDSGLNILGFLVGYASNSLRLFSPAGLVLRALHCSIPT